MFGRKKDPSPLIQAVVDKLKNHPERFTFSDNSDFGSDAFTYKDKDTEFSFKVWTPWEGRTEVTGSVDLTRADRRCLKAAHCRYYAAWSRKVTEKRTHEDECARREFEKAYGVTK